VPVSVRIDPLYARKTALKREFACLLQSDEFCEFNQRDRIICRMTSGSDCFF
jgi:hypothetical protein